jgi:hypothetical protein
MSSLRPLWFVGGGTASLKLMDSKCCYLLKASSRWFVVVVDNGEHKIQRKMKEKSNDFIRSEPLSFHRTAIPARLRSFLTQLIGARLSGQLFIGP